MHIYMQCIHYVKAAIHVYFQLFISYIYGSTLLFFKLNNMSEIIHVSIQNVFSFFV